MGMAEEVPEILLRGIEHEASTPLPTLCCRVQRTNPGSSISTLTVSNWCAQGIVHR